MIIVKLFAAVAQKVGQRELTLPAEGRTVADLLTDLRAKYPALEKLSGILLVAVNHQYVSHDYVLKDGDEVGLIPPVSGGSAGAGPSVSEFSGSLFVVTDAPLSADAIAAKVINPYAGAVVTFIGTVREYTRGRRTVHLEYEAYAEMAVGQMAQIGREIEDRWPGARTAIWHRTGKLEIGEASVVIAVATPHRAGAYEACRYAIERLKKIVPIWKKEVWEDGEEWVGAQEGP
jgi:molybdopterin synthase catalytic subunit